jgi:hypothetical protein
MKPRIPTRGRRRHPDICIRHRIRKKSVLVLSRRPWPGTASLIFLSISYVSSILVESLPSPWSLWIFLVRLMCPLCTVSSLHYRNDYIILQMYFLSLDWTESCLRQQCLYFLIRHKSWHNCLREDPQRHREGTSRIQGKRRVKKEVWIALSAVCKSFGGKQRISSSAYYSQMNEWKQIVR